MGLFLKIILMLFIFNEVFIVASAFPQMQFDNHWEIFKELYQKSYEKQEENQRREAWENHLANMFSHNLLYDMKKMPYRQSLNEYSDMDNEEFQKIMNGFISSPETEDNPPNETLSAPNTFHSTGIPSELDWREYNLVTRVKNQGRCGSCYAFAALGALESQQKIKNGKLVSLSEQNIVDCARPEGVQGCNGGSFSQVFQYVRDHDGIDTEEVYPYIGRENRCHFNPLHRRSSCSGYRVLPQGDEKALLEAVATIGPITTAFHGNRPGFRHYGGGIYDDQSCNSNTLNHAMVIIGYGSEDGRDYWLAKNSYGTSWGIGGYIKVARNKNMCGIASYAVFPVVR